MPNPLFDKITRDAIGLKNRNAAMPERMEPAFLQSQLAKDRLELPSYAILRERSSFRGLEYSARHALVKVLFKHFSKREFNTNDAVALLGLDRSFLAAPNATPDEYPTRWQVQVFNVQAKCFACPQTCAGQSGEQWFPLACCCVDDLQHLGWSEVSLFFNGGLG